VEREREARKESQEGHAVKTKTAITITGRKGRKRELAFLSDEEFKKLVDEYGFSGAARRIKELYGIEISKQTIRNEARRKGILVSKKDIKSGFQGEFFIKRVLRALGFNVKWIGKLIGKGPDISFKVNGEDIWCEVKNWRFNRRIDAGMVKSEIISRFRGKKGRKVVIFMKKMGFTKKALELLEENGIEIVYLDENESLSFYNWSRMFRKALGVLGSVFGRFIELLNAEIGLERKYLDLADMIVEVEDYEFVDEGGGGLRQWLYEPLVKVFNIVNGGMRKLLVSGWKRMVVDVSGMARLDFIEKGKGGGSMGDIKEVEIKLEKMRGELDSLIRTVRELSKATKLLVEKNMIESEKIEKMLERHIQKITKIRKNLNGEIYAIQKGVTLDTLVSGLLKGKMSLGQVLKALRAKPPARECVAGVEVYNNDQLIDTILRGEASAGLINEILTERKKRR
jgi:hypothetical protein